MASVLILSNTTEGIPLCERLVKNGHICKLFSSQKITLPYQVHDPLRLLEQFDLIISTSTKMGDIAEECKDKGHLVIGGGVFNTRLETDMNYAQSVVATLYKDLSILQNAEESIEVEVTGWFSNSKFSYYNYSVRGTRLHEFNKGPLANEVGYVVMSSLENKLTKRVFDPIVGLLTKVTYHGPLTINTIVNKEDLIIDKFYTSLGRSFYGYTELIKGSVFDFLWKFDKDGSLLTRGGTAVAVGLSLPPYPYEDISEEIIDIKVPDEAVNHTFLCNIGNSQLGWVTARGVDILEARRRVYRTIDNLKLEDVVQYRQDIPSEVKEFSLLKQWGWLDA